MASRGMAVADGLTPGASLSRGDSVQLHIRALAAGGAGVADLPDGRVVFVHRTAPGDEIEARVDVLRSRWGRAHLVRVLEPGAGRVAPRCPLYDRCGGCSLQHIDYDDQTAWKGRFIADALTRIGGIDIASPKVVPSPSPWHYRNRVTYTLLRLPGGRVVAGYHGLGRPDRIVDVGDECLLPELPIGAAWTALRQVWGPGAGRLPQGKELRVTIRSTDDGVVLLIRGGREGWKPGDLQDLLPGVAAIWHQPAAASAPVRLVGDNTFEAWGEERFPLGSTAFLQVNREASVGLAAWVLEAVGTVSSAVDAFCGAGIYGRALARAGAKAVGVELDPEACTAARHEAPAGFSVLEGRVEDRLAEALPAEVVILNPPRAGVDAQVTELLLAQRPGRLIYVSCDPATLARDSARLAAGYRLTELKAFDLFPQTAHVESVAVFEEK